jgi:hypothetical protein
MAGLASLAFIATIGCDGTMLSFNHGRSFKLFSLPLAGTPGPATQPSDSTPIASPSPSTTKVVETVADNDPDLARLNETVNQFVARFPPADPARPDSPPTRSEKKTIQQPQVSTAHPATLPAVDLADAGKPTPAANNNHLDTTANPPPSPSNSAAPTQSNAGAEESPSEPVAATHLGPTVPAKTSANSSAHLEAAASPQPPAVPTPAETSSGQPIVEIVDIRPAPEPAPQNKTENESLTASANQPAENDHRSPAEDIMQMIAQLETTIRAHPQQLDDQFKLRLLYLATGQKDRAVAPFKDVDPVQAEVLSALFKTMAGAQDALRDPATGTSRAMTAAAELHRLLAEQAPVTISKIALVTAVDSFGDYKAVQPLLFPPGRPVHVFCYCEIGNFRSESTTDGRLRTLLAAALEVYDPTGRIVWQQKVPQIEDLVYTPRRDFFIPLEIKLPSTLAPGEYVLKVTIEDKLAATTDQQRLTFTIGK